MKSKTSVCVCFDGACVCACAAIRFNLINPRDDSVGLVIDKKREIKFSVSHSCVFTRLKIITKRRK